MVAPVVQVAGVSSTAAAVTGVGAVMFTVKGLAQATTVDPTGRTTTL